MIEIDMQRQWIKNYAISIEDRISMLQHFQTVLLKNEMALEAAILKDLGKSQFEFYTTELAIVYREIKKMLKWLKKGSICKSVKGYPLLAKKSILHYGPLGQVLIIAPFNYPVQLSLLPLINSIACGNVNVLKLSELVPNTSALLNEIIKNSFDANIVKVYQGGPEVSQNLLAKPYDLIFFTGSERVGKIVLESASHHLTPVVLELGGKSPAIILEGTDLHSAVKKILWAKRINAGQTCVAPDYVLVPKSLQESFIQTCVKDEMDYLSNISKQSTENLIVNEPNVLRLKEILKVYNDAIIQGGQWQGRHLTLTLLNNVNPDTEIFGPILPIVTYDSQQDLLIKLQNYPDPLTAYIFGNEKIAHSLAVKIRSGSVAINECLSHIAHPYLPFGGVGKSGMGHYHGKYSIETFSHIKPIVYGWKGMNPFLKLPIRHWYQDKRIIRKFF